MTASFDLEAFAPGWLSIGPYVPLEPGMYDLTLHYMARGKPGNPNNYELWSIAGGDHVFIGGGQLADTAGLPGTISMPFRFPSARNLNLGVYFVGAGELSISAVEIDRIGLPSTP